MFEREYLERALERHQELLREAEKLRLIRQATSGSRRRNAVLSKALLWLGQRLLDWGCRLEERFRDPEIGAASSSPCGSYQPA